MRALQVMTVGCFISVFSGLTCCGQNEPTKATRTFLAERLERSHAESKLGNWMMVEAAPIETLLYAEVIDPGVAELRREKGYVDGSESVSVCVLIPNGSRYFDRLRRQLLMRGGWHFQLRQHAKLEACVSIAGVCRDSNNRTVAVIRQFIVEFHEQTDADGDGNWDEPTCWEAVPFLDDREP